MSYMALKNKKRIIKILIVCGSLAFILFGRLIYIQAIKSKHYEEKAYEQQTRQRSVAAKRGTIYDATGEKVLAQSVSVNIVTAVPNSVDKDKKDEIATKIAEILEINKDDVLAKLSKNSSSETIATKVDENKATKLLNYISDEQISGIRVDEDTKRIYPYSTLLANVLGFVGTDNVGLEGVEAYYNSDLAGVPGKIVGSTDGKGRETPFTNEQYVAPTDGKDIVLTDVAKNLPGVDFNREQFPGLVFKLKDPKTAALIFSSGKLVCTGAKSIDDSKLAIRKTVDLMREIDTEIPHEFEIKIQNIVASANLESTLNLEAVALELENTEYEPEQFPGLVYRLTDPKVVLLLFGSGKVVCTGAKTRSDAKLGVERAYDRLKELDLI